MRCRIAGRVRVYPACLRALLLVGGWLFVFAPPIRAQSPNQIALVVIHGDGSAVTRCVDFNEPELNGYDILQRSQFSLSIDPSGMGAAICAIDGEGCTVPQEDCFCGMKRTPSVYWSYWQVVNGQWQYSQLGAGNTVVKPGTVEGWVWGTGNVGGATPLPAYSFAQICAPATATPTLTLTPQPAVTAPPATPSPTFTAAFTSWPTTTATPPIPTETPTPSPTPSWTPSPTLSPIPTWTSRPTVTSTFLPTHVATNVPANVGIAKQPTIAPTHLVRLPAVQAPAPAATLVVEPTAALVAIVEPSVTPSPSTTPTPSATPTATNSPQVVALVVTATPASVATVDVETHAVMAAEIITIVVTAPASTVATIEMSTPMAVAMGPTLLPGETPAAAEFSAQMGTLASIVLGIGALIAIPAGVVIMAVIAYWIGQKL